MFVFTKLSVEVWFSGLRDRAVLSVITEIQISMEKKIDSKNFRYKKTLNLSN